MKIQGVFRTSTLAAALIALLLGLTACGSPAPKLGTLYQRLGGEEGVAQVAQDFSQALQADARVRDRFAKVDMVRFKQQVAAQICAIGGGPCEASDRNLRTAYEGMKIGNIEFDAFIGDLAKALDQHRIGATEQRELLFALKSKRAEVLGLPS